jgi:DNA helicase-2/ATP-dependent DNA helicase PcrA
MNSLKRGGKIVAVGDDRQAIYAFRGAGENTMEELRETLQADVLPLSITYRCPVSVVKLAQNIVPDLQWAPGAQMGVIDFKSEKEFLSEVRPGDLVISRANAPLMVYSMELLVQGKRCVILGRDISAGLIALLDQVGREDIVELLTALDDYVIAETPKLIAAKKEDKAEELSDRVAALRALSEGLSNTAALRARIDNLFGEEENAPANAIIFSTVHKAKGLEFKRVWMFESTFRTHTVEGQNLYYVAITRAMETLHLVQLPTKNGKPPHSSAMYWMQQQEDQ